MTLDANPLSIVLVDDDEDDYVLTRDLLTEIEKGRYELHWVSTYNDAVESMRQARADVYLVDYRLGKHSGLDLLKDAFQQGVRAPIILLTGKGNRDVDVQALAAGAADYLVKGEINSLLLDRAIRYAIEHKQIEERLRESEGRYRGIVNDQTELICRFRPDGTLTFVNPACTRYYGMRIEELIGSDVSRFIVEEDRPIFRAQIASLNLDRPATPYYEFRVRMPGAGIRWQQWMDRALFDEHGFIAEYQSVGRDVTERRLAEQREHEQRSLAEALRDTAESLGASLHLDEVLERILANIGRVIPHESANIVFIDPDTREARVARHRGASGATEVQQLMALRLPINFIPTFRQMYETGQPLIIADTEQFEGWIHLNETDWIRSYAGIPIRVQNQVIGFLNVNSAQPGYFSPEQAGPLRAFADQASVAIQNSQLYDSARRAAARAQAQARLASSLISSLDLDTVLHKVCAEIALALDMPSVDIQLYNPPKQELVFAAGVGLPPDYGLSLKPLPRERLDAFRERLGELFVIHDIQAEPNLPNADLQSKHNLRTVLVAVISRDQELMGMVNVLSFGNRRAYSQDERDLLRGLADQASLAIINARLFTETQRRLQNVQALRAIDVAITSSLDMRLTLNVILDQVVAQLNVDAAALLVLTDAGLTLEYTAARGFRGGGPNSGRLKLGEGVAGRAALQRQIIRIPDVSQISSHFGRPTLIADESFVAYIGVPLIAKGQVKGVLEIYQRSSLSTEPEWLDFLETLAGQAAIAIDSSSLFHDLQRSNAELIIAYDATIEGWSRALDLRDKETEGHTQRVTEMTLLLARQFEFSDEELVHIRRGALLHDIGKMGIPDSILLKPGPLTDEEWQIMKLHPVYAQSMLAPITYLRRAIDIPYCHHEKWDGTGYPRGLKGDQIPLAARIFAAVDVWDALRSDRPYRAAWPEARVREHINSLSGTHFDPLVAGRFLNTF